MAKQLICDRCRTVIGEGQEFYTLKDKQNESKEIDFCQTCWNDFVNFMEVKGEVTVEQPAQGQLPPVEPATQAEQTQPAQPQPETNTVVQPQ